MIAVKIFLIAFILLAVTSLRAQQYNVSSIPDSLIQDADVVNGTRKQYWK